MTNKLNFSIFGTDLKNFLAKHWLAIILVAVGSWLRTTQLPGRGILFGDSGRDLLAAAQAVETKQIPLLGIPSSVPRFKQGPLTIWLSMGVYQLFGSNPTAFYWAFGLIGCLSLIAIYEFSILVLDQKVGLTALSLLAASPLAVAHSRMPYHTAPIILTTILALFALTLVYHRQKWSLAIATFAVCLVFQHELSLFPLFAAIPICWWLGGISKNQNWKVALKMKSREVWLAMLALGLGLGPQIISEIKDNSHQLTGFAIWLGYRVVSFFLPNSEHFGASTFLSGLNTSLNYWQRVFVVPAGWTTTFLVLGLVGLSLFGWIILVRGLKSFKDLSAGQVVVLLTTGLITLGYLMHGAPSEAYFPVYGALLPLIIAIGLGELKPPLKILSQGWLLGIFIVAVMGIYQANFWVDQLSSWNYGPSVQTQINSLKWANNSAQDSNFSISSPDPDARFEHYLDNYVWLGKSLNLNLKSLTGYPSNIQAGDFYIVHSQANRPTEINFTSFHSLGRKVIVGAVFVQPTSLIRYNPN